MIPLPKNNKREKNEKDLVLESWMHPAAASSYRIIIAGHATRAGHAPAGARPPKESALALMPMLKRARHAQVKQPASACTLSTLTCASAHELHIGQTASERLHAQRSHPHSCPTTARRSKSANTPC